MGVDGEDTCSFSGAFAQEKLKGRKSRAMGRRTW